MTVPAEGKVLLECVAQHADSWTPPLPSKPFPLLDFSILSALPSFPNTPRHFAPLPLLFQLLISDQVLEALPLLSAGSSESLHVIHLLPLLHTSAGNTPQKHGCHQSSDPATHHSNTLKDSLGLTGSPGALFHCLHPRAPIHLSTAL